MDRRCCCYNQHRLRKLGAGSSGIVYELLDSDCVSTGRALKRFGTLEECLKEYNFVKNLQHDNIIKCFGEPRSEGQYHFLVLEFMSKLSLDKVYCNQRLDELEVKRFIFKILKAVKYLHERNIAHGDIKGPNCLVGLNNELKVADFGRASNIEGEQEAAVREIISPPWAPPEVRSRGKSYFPKPADVYRVGCTWIEIYSRGCPVQYPKLYGTCGKIPEVPPTVPEGAAKLIRQCLARNPQDRPTAAVLLNDMYFQGVEHVDERQQQGPEKDPEESGDGVHIFDGPWQIYEVLDSSTQHSSSCCMTRARKERGQLALRSECPVDTVEEVFHGRKPNNADNNNCLPQCNFLKLPSMADGDGGAQ